MSGISKYFGGLQALSNVDMTLEKGELLAIVGDNGAGKSTLIKLLTGVYTPSKGSIQLNGKEIQIPNRRASLDLGIEAVYQNLGLVDYLSAPENVFLGKELKRNFLGFSILDNHRMRKEAKLVLKDRLGVELENLNQPTFNLSGGQRQAVAIARSIYAENIKILVLDEPTAALGPEETRRTLNVVKRLKGSDMGIIMISHQLEHVFAIADRVLVMRRGRVAGVRDVKKTTRQDVLGLIVGADSDEVVTTPSPLEQPEVRA